MAMPPVLRLAVFVEPSTIDAIGIVGSFAAVVIEGHHGDIRIVELLAVKPHQVEHLLAVYVHHHVLVVALAPLHGDADGQRTAEPTATDGGGVGHGDILNEICHETGPMRQPGVHLLHLGVEALVPDGPALGLATHGTLTQIGHIPLTFAPAVGDDAVLHGGPLRLILLHKLGTAKEVGKELRHIVVVAVAPQRVAAHHRLGIVGKVVMARHHLPPVEVVTGIEVPQRTHHPRAIAVLMEIDGTGGRQLHVVDELLQLQILDERGDVEQLLHLGIVFRLDGLLQLGEDGAHRVDGVRRGIFVLGVLNGSGHAIHLGPEIVVGLRTLVGTVVNIECQQDATLVAHVHTVLALLHLLGKLVDTTIVAIDKHLHVARMVGERQAQPLSRLEDKSVHQVGHVAIVGQQHPVLRLRQAQQLMLLVQLQAQRLLIVPEERAVATATNLRARRVVGERTAAVHIDEAVLVFLFRGDVEPVVGGDEELEHPIMVFCFLLGVILNGQTVNLLQFKGHHGTARRIQQQTVLLAAHLHLSYAVGSHRDVPLTVGHTGMHVQSLLGISHRGAQKQGHHQNVLSEIKSTGHR